MVQALSCKQQLVMTHVFLKPGTHPNLTRALANTYSHSPVSNPVGVQVLEGIQKGLKHQLYGIALRQAPSVSASRERICCGTIQEAKRKQAPLKRGLSEMHACLLRAQDSQAGVYMLRHMRLRLCTCG